MLMLQLPRRPTSLVKNPSVPFSDLCLGAEASFLAVLYLG